MKSVPKLANGIVGLLMILCCVVSIGVLSMLALWVGARGVESIRHQMLPTESGLELSLNGKTLYEWLDALNSPYFLRFQTDFESETSYSVKEVITVLLHRKRMNSNEAVNAVRTMGTNAIPILLNWLTTKNPTLRALAEDGFYVLGEKAMTPLLAQYDGTANSAVTHALSVASEGNFNALLEAWLSGSITQQQSIGLFLAGGFDAGDPDSNIPLWELTTVRIRPFVPKLIRLLRSDSGVNRALAGELLGLAGKEAVCALPMLREIELASDENLRRTAQRAIARINENRRWSRPLKGALISRSGEPTVLKRLH